MTEKIGFVGAGCTGKSTLIDGLKADFVGQSDIVFVPEAARLFFSENDIPVSERFAYEAQEQIQAIALANEVEKLESEPRLAFCDRTVLDAAVYVTAHGDRIGGLSLQWFKY